MSSETFETASDELGSNSVRCNPCVAWRHCDSQELSRASTSPAAMAFNSPVLPRAELRRTVAEGDISRGAPSTSQIQVMTASPSRLGNDLRTTPSPVSVDVQSKLARAASSKGAVETAAVPVWRSAVKTSFSPDGATTKVAKPGQDEYNVVEKGVATWTAENGLTDTTGAAEQQPCFSGGESFSSKEAPNVALEAGAGACSPTAMWPAVAAVDSLAGEIQAEVQKPHYPASSGWVAPTPLSPVMASTTVGSAVAETGRIPSSAGTRSTVALVCPIPRRITAIEVSLHREICALNGSTPTLLPSILPTSSDFMGNREDDDKGAQVETAVESVAGAAEHMPLSASPTGDHRWEGLWPQSGGQLSQGAKGDNRFFQESDHAFEPTEADLAASESSLHAGHPFHLPGAVSTDVEPDLGTDEVEPACHLQGEPTGASFVRLDPSWRQVDEAPVDEENVGGDGGLIEGGRGNECAVRGPASPGEEAGPTRVRSEAEQSTRDEKIFQSGVRHGVRLAIGAVAIGLGAFGVGVAVGAAIWGRRR